MNKQRKCPKCGKNLAYSAYMDEFLCSTCNKAFFEDIDGTMKHKAQIIDNGVTMTRMPIQEKKKPKLFIEIFAGGGMVPVQMLNPVVRLIQDLNQNGIDLCFDPRPGGPYVMKERNVTVQRFMDTDCTHLLFIDADLAFDPTAARKMLLKDKPLIGGLYRYKADVEAYPCQLYVNEETGDYYEKDGLYKAAGIPTGFMMIRRDVIEKMYEAYPETQYELKDSYSGQTIARLYDLFSCLLYNKQWWGEDYIFCRRWTAIGGDCWVMPDIDFVHFGMQGFGGNWSKFYDREKDRLIEENRREVSAA